MSQGTLDRKRATRGLRALAEDPDWEVREWAAEALNAVLAIDFPGALALCREWAAAGSEELQRAVALALGFRTKAKVQAEVKPMLAIMEKLTTKPGDYLQKNLGPFALGGAFLSRLPEETLALCRRVASRKNENGRWNVAMVFTTAAARKHAEPGRAILDQLAEDGRPRIERAVEKARKNLARKS